MIPKKTILLILILFIVCGILLFIAYAFTKQVPQQSSPSQTQEPSPPESTTGVRVLSMEPLPSALLSPNTKQAFLINFNKSTDLETLNVTITEKNIFTDAEKQIPATITINQQKTQARFTPNTNLLANTTYTISVIEKSSGKVLFTQKYETANVQPTAVPDNNPRLQEFLPYETHTYALSYWPERNIYVFGFKYNPDDADDTQTQFEKAQQNALTYIRSKGIDPNSLVIDWKY